MKTIRCGIVDDEPLAVKLIENFIKRTPFLEHTLSFTDSIEAMTQLRERPVELLFLDIQMPDMDGIELARMLPAQTHIVFTTAFREYALESYDVEALDFLTKPLHYDKFMRATEKARRWFEHDSEPAAESLKGIFLRHNGVMQRVALDHIVFVEGLKDYVRFILDGEKHSLITHLTMKAVEDILPAERFIRVSRSHIISLNRIRSVNRNIVYIGDTMVKVTDMYREVFLAFLNGRVVGK